MCIGLSISTRKRHMKWMVSAGIKASNIVKAN
jgi:hypothetical protein